MTNLIHTCLILQYVHYNPLHVSSIICSSSGGMICIDAASGIVYLSKWPSGAQVERELNLCTGRPLTERTIPDTASIKFKPPDDEHVILETCRGL